MHDMNTFISFCTLKCRKLFPIILISFLLLNHAVDLKAQNYGSFPYEENFMGTAQPADVTKPASPLASVPNKAAFTDKGLQLTPNEPSSFGGVFINNRSFTSKNGIFIEFEYMVYGGTGGDGISVFLFDQNTANPTIGALGAGLGYAYNRAYLNNQFRDQRMPGLTGAYMGVALDSYGNFKAMRYQGESRVNGIAYSMPVANSFNDSDNVGNQVTIRGAKGTPLTFPGVGDGYTGYPVLITQSTIENKGFILNYDPEQNTYMNDGRYRRFNNFGKDPFLISGGSEFEDERDPSYRKAIIELFPVAPENEGGFYVTVKIQHGSILDTIVYDYHYKSTAFIYPENAITDGNAGDEGSATDLPRFSFRPINMTATVPEIFNIGFAASTGEKTNFHIIKNLKLTLPRATEANNDYIEEEQGITNIPIYPLDNDIAYTGIIQRFQTGSKDYINKNTFRFLDSEGQVTPNPYYYSQPGVGAWTYIPATGIINFVPDPTFTGEATINYDIKGGIDDVTKELPYDDEAYRSLPALITVNILPNSSPPRQIVTNKMITVKLK